MKHMSQEQKATKKHFIFDKWVLVFLLVIPTFFLIYFGGALISQTLLGSEGKYDSIVVTALSLIYLIIFLLRFRGEFDGILGWSTTGLLLLIPTLSFVVYNVVSNLLDGTPVGSPVAALIAALTPGVCEEIIFRAVPCSNMMRLKSGGGWIVLNVFLSSCFFGLMHLLNLTSGAELGATLFQTFYAFCVAAPFAAVLLRTGTIVPCMIIHTLVDFSSMIFDSPESTGPFEVDVNVIIVAVLSVAFLVWAAYLVRPSKHAEIIELWDRKWHKEY